MSAEAAKNGKATVQAFIDSASNMLPDVQTAYAKIGTTAANALQSNQQLELYAKVGSVAEAKTMAEKHLRLHNKFSKTVQFTHTGHVWYVAGVGIRVKGYCWPLSMRCLPCCRSSAL